ncbi:RNA-binding domain-containing protein [Methanococcoides burtonii]|uniref:Divergent AAA domain protein n=1 Tax=Methanococcoides burtonii (strain DSM 6242 / NBRC 107633 / OCM 468 / ACE-M) TaxID=259564 RepID=Q12YL1_METBU|nr:RNA-binding domain-containing protein [Methanococcoides burtonii]ABE51465.1 Divergent AAA domain protein [Methanococcoides burtonii DSM 6242]
MDKTKLFNRLDDLEWEDFEVKEAKSSIPKSSFETVSAFSNTNGGWLVFGVEQLNKDFEITGVEDAERIEQNFTTALRGDKFNQKIRVKSTKYDFDGKIVLAFYVPASEQKPVYFNSRKNTFIRTGSGDQRATDVEIDAMYRDSSFGLKDKELTGFTIDDLDERTISDYRTYLENVNPEHRYNKLSMKELLEKLQVVVDGRITIGGLLVFGNEDNINRMLTDFRIDYLEIMGTSYSDAPTRYNYRLYEEENLFRFYFSIFERLMKKIDLPFTLRPDGFATDNQPQLTAIREALVNLLMHSDYFSPMKPRIRVFLDRIEFLNPGSLPKDIESIMKEDFTMPRNPIITRIFRVIKLSENAGSGFDKMFTGWKSYYETEPVVSNDIDFYKITFPLVKDTISDKASEEMSEKTRGKTREKTREKILDIMSQTPKITTAELAELTGITAKGVEWHIKKLKDEGLLKRIGADKGGMWEVVNR